jgi:hypothetical protein
MVSEEGLIKFKKLYKKNYGVELSSKDLIAKANKLLNLYKAVYGLKANIKINISNEKEIQFKKTE